MAFSIEELEAELQALLQEDVAGLPFLSFQSLTDLQRRSCLEPRDTVLIGIRVGTISADDLYYRVRPAVIALTVLLDAGGGRTGPELVRRIREDAGGKPRPWAQAVVAADSWSGSLHSLLRQRQEPADPAGRRLMPAVLSGLDDHLWRGSNILLALAPPETLARIAADAAPSPATGRIIGDPEAVRCARALLRIAGHAPLSRPFVDHALRPEASARVRLQLTANPLAPDATLRSLLAFADHEPGIAAAVCMNECASAVLRLVAYRRLRVPQVRQRVRAALAPEVAVALDIEEIAAATAQEAHVVYALIRDLEPDLSPEARLFLYAHLARISGPEAVWNLELARTGSLEAMRPAVRASMESGALTPLLEAAVAAPYRGLRDQGRERGRRAAARGVAELALSLAGRR
ncbi:hypothetical protein KGQ20_14745 [Catenulispora sp. NF23]|uniref:hypothetical protein n=1 Tax=Catenulispora pinistramenti TaxID=2705254 RepID=UPI001BA73F37|nr:hypothetical protein [Catenulispora pinistramenti]MBS2534030.1 hypothetical protein [Catenulispora pinistramenti]